MNTRNDTDTDTNKAADTTNAATPAALTNVTFSTLPPIPTPNDASGRLASITVIQPTQRRFDDLRRSLAAIACVDHPDACYAVVELSTQTLVFRLSDPATSKRARTQADHKKPLN